MENLHSKPRPENWYSSFQLVRRTKLRSNCKLQSWEAAARPFPYIHSRSSCWILFPFLPSISTHLSHVLSPQDIVLLNSSCLDKLMFDNADWFVTINRQPDIHLNFSQMQIFQKASPTKSLLELKKKMLFIFNFTNTKCILFEEK